MALQLSEGSIQKIMTGASCEPPVLQVLGVRKLNSPVGSSDRYRIMLSDGIHSINFAMLGTQLNPKVESGEIAEHAIIRLSHHITSKLNKDKNGDRRVLIILGVEPLVAASDVNMKLGNPVSFSDDDANSGRAPEPAAPQQVKENVNMSNGNSAAFSGGPRAAKIPRLGEVNINGKDVITRPINSINNYQNKWVIRARVVSKSNIRTWSNSRGEGKLFSMDLKDETGEIRATAFKEEVDKFYDAIELNHVYYISQCVVKPANKKFSTLNNDFELTFSRETQVTPVNDAVTTIPGFEYNFQPLANIASIGVNDVLDIVAIAKSANDVQTFVARSSNREMKKREVQLVDNSNTQVTLTLWGESAEDFDSTDCPVIVLRQAKVTEYQGGRFLTTSMGTVMLRNPDIPEAHRLRGWYDNGGANENATVISIASSGGASGGAMTGDWKSLGSVKEEQLGCSDTGDYYNVVANVMTVRRENCYYLSCPAPDCKKKVLDNHNGTYRCEKCAKDYEDCQPRMIVQISFGDWSDNTYATMFDNEAQQLLGIDGRELLRRKNEQEDLYNATFDAVKFIPLQLRMRVKLERYNDENRLKTVVHRLEPFNAKEYNRRIFSEIKTLMENQVQIKPEPHF